MAKKKSTRPAKVKRIDARDEAIKNASASFDRSVEDFKKFVENFGVVNEEFAKDFKKTLSHTERSQLEVHAAAKSIQRQFANTLFSMSEAGQSFSDAGKYLGDIIRTKVEDSLQANRSEAREIRKDIDSLRAAAAKLHGEERKKIESLIDTASDQLKQVSGSASIFKEAILRRFDPANMVEKMLGGGVIGGIFGDMIRVKQERKKSAGLIAMQTEARQDQSQREPQGEQVYSTFQDDIKSIVRTVGRTQQTSDRTGIDDPIDTDLEIEEKEREAARRLKMKAATGTTLLGGKSGKGFAGALQQAIMKALAISKILGWLKPVFMFLFTGLKFFVLKPLFVKLPLLIYNSMLKPLGLLLYNSMLKPLGLLLYNSMIRPLAVWSMGFIAKFVAAIGLRSGLGGAAGTAISGGARRLGGWARGGVREMGASFTRGRAGRTAAATAGRGTVSRAAATAGRGTVSRAAGTASTATSRAPKKGILKSLADGIRAFGRKGILRGIINLGLLAIALIPFAIAMKMFSKGVNFTGVVMFASSITVLVVAVRALDAGRASMMRGALALAALGVSIVPLAFGLNLMKGVGFGTVVVLAATLVVLGVAVAAFAAAVATGVGGGVLAIAIGLLGLLGVALIPFGYAAKLAGEGMSLLGDGFRKMGQGAALVVGAIFDGITGMLDKFIELSAIGGGGLLSAAAGIVAVGAALLVFTAAGVAAMAIASAGNVVGSFLTLGGLLGAKAPGPFDMLKMFLAFGQFGPGIKEGAKGIDDLASSMKKFAGMDTESIKEGVNDVVKAINEFSRAAFRAAFYGGIGNFLLGAKPLDSFMKISEAGPGLQIAAGGISSLAKAFISFQDMAKSGAMAMFQGSSHGRASAFKNLIVDLNHAFDELETDKWDKKIDVLERMAQALQNISQTQGEKIQFPTVGPVDPTQPQGQFTGPRSKAARMRDTFGMSLHRAMAQEAPSADETFTATHTGLSAAKDSESNKGKEWDRMGKKGAKTGARQKLVTQMGPDADKSGITVDAEVVDGKWVGTATSTPGSRDTAAQGREDMSQTPFERTQDAQGPTSGILPPPIAPSKLGWLEGAEILNPDEAEKTGILKVKGVQEIENPNDDFDVEDAEAWATGNALQALAVYYGGKTPPGGTLTDTKQETIDGVEVMSATVTFTPHTLPPQQQRGKTALAPDDPRNAWADSGNPNLRAKHRRLTTPSTATMGRETEGVGTAVIPRSGRIDEESGSWVNRSAKITGGEMKMAKGQAKLRAQGALRDELGLTDSLPPGVQYKTTIDKENQLVTTIAYIGKMVEEIDDKITAESLRGGGPDPWAVGAVPPPRTVIGPRTQAPIGSAPTEAYETNVALQENALLARLERVLNTTGGGDVSVANAVSNVVNSQDMLFAHNPSTRNSEPSLQDVARSNQHDRIR